MVVYHRLSGLFVVITRIIACEKSVMVMSVMVMVIVMVTSVIFPSPGVP